MAKIEKPVKETKVEEVVKKGGAIVKKTYLISEYKTGRIKKKVIKVENIINKRSKNNESKRRIKEERPRSEAGQERGAQEAGQENIKREDAFLKRRKDKREDLDNNRV